MKTPLVPLVGFVMAAIQLPQLRADAFDMTKARNEIEEADRAFCETLRKGDAAALAKFFTEDGKSMGPNEPAQVGREKI